MRIASQVASSRFSAILRNRLRRAIAQFLRQLKRVLVEDERQLVDGVVHLDLAMAVLLKNLVHELGIDEERARLDRSGKHKTVSVKNGPAAGLERLDLMLLPIGAGNGLLASDRLKIGDAADQRDHEQDDQYKDEPGTSR